MSFIAIMHPIMFTQAADCHQQMPPEAPPIGPPPGLPQPAWPYYGAYLPWVGEALTGKFTDGSELCHGFGICLWQHDWGMLQPHIAVPVNMWMGIMLPGTTRKLQLPAGLVEMKQTGGLLAPPGGSSKAAPSFPCGIMVCQSCWDISGWSFCVPTGMVFCMPNMVMLGVTLGDIFAGVCAMIADSLRGLAGSAVGNAATAGIANKLLGNLVGNLIGTALQTAWSAAQGPGAAAVPSIAPYVTPGDVTQATPGQLVVNALVATTPIGMALTGLTPFDFAASTLAGKGPKL